MNPSAEVILQAEKLCKIYSMGDIVVNALKEVDLALHRGELLVLLDWRGVSHCTKREPFGR